MHINKNHITLIEKSFGEQGFSIKVFEFDKEDVKKEDILSLVIKKNFFSKSSNCCEGSLKPLFNNKKIFVDDFKTLCVNELKDFLFNFSKSNDWGNDVKDYLKLLSKFKQIISFHEIKNFYLINKDWFENNKKMRDPEFWIYDYYFIIVWVNSKEKKMFFCEWFSD